METEIAAAGLGIFADPAHPWQLGTQINSGHQHLFRDEGVDDADTAISNPFLDQGSEPVENTANAGQDIISVARGQRRYQIEPYQWSRGTGL